MWPFELSCNHLCYYLWNVFKWGMNTLSMSPFKARIWTLVDFVYLFYDWTWWLRAISNIVTIQPVIAPSRLKTVAYWFMYLLWFCMGGKRAVGCACNSIDWKLPLAAVSAVCSLLCRSVSDWQMKAPKCNLMVLYEFVSI